MADNITIRKAEGKWVIRACGAVRGETEAALEVRESGHDPVMYIPRADIAMAFFEPSDDTTTCKHKGKASYFTLHGHSATIEDAAWSYESPHKNVRQIKNHLAFHPDDVRVLRA